jgi:SRSO17 transposase
MHRCTGHALTGRELYLPQSWTEDQDRCRAAGIPGDIEFATKPRQAQAMIRRAIEAGAPFAWFTAGARRVRAHRGWMRAQRSLKEMLS